MKYGFFPGCTHTSDAGYAESVREINRLLRIELEPLSDWNCCGATSSFSLNRGEALALTGRLFAIAERQGFEQIVTTCNACYTTLRKARSIFLAEPASVKIVNGKLAKEKLLLNQPLPVRHYVELLVEDVPSTVWAEKRKADFSHLRVAAYYGCQFTRPWQKSGSGKRPDLLENLLEKLGYTPVFHSAQTSCCGASHYLPHENACRQLIARIVSEAKRKGAHLITTICPLCQLNLDAGQQGEKAQVVPVPYITQLAGLSLGVSPEKLGMKKLLIRAEALLNTSVVAESV